jgi:methionyl-tRNA formyltransferase
MRLLMMGTGPFAVPTFESLLDSEHQMVALVTRPTPPPKGRVKSPPNPMRDVAEQRGVRVLTPADVNAAEVREQLAACQPDLLVVCDYGQILSVETLGCAPLGGVNLHASLLPLYRGAAPINWALLDGREQTGVTVIHMTPRLDGGPCLVQIPAAIGPSEEAPELERRLAQIGVGAVQQAIALVAAWDRHSPLGVRQDPALATRARRLRKEDGDVQWDRPAVRIFNQVRALKPWPGTYSVWRGQDGAELRVILDRVSLAAAGPCAAPPGEVVHAAPQQLWVATGDGVLSLDCVQPAGKRAMLIAEFLRGHGVQVGDAFLRTTRS